MLGIKVEMPHFPHGYARVCMRIMAPVAYLVCLSVLTTAMWHSVAALSQHSPTPLLIVEPMNGLSNRLRVIASARALAAASRRRLLLVWTRDVQCNASIASLLRVEEELVVTPPLQGHVRMYESPRTTIVRLASTREDVYVRTPFVIPSDVDYRMGPVFRRMRFSHTVETIARSIDVDATVSAHIRMETDMARDVPNAPRDVLASFSGASSHRARCHWSAFVPLIRHVGGSLVLSSDVEWAVENVRRVTSSPVRGLPLPRGCYSHARRWQHCVQHALAHILVLSRASTLLLSEWSSYSELIHWLAPRRALAINGCHPQSVGERHHTPSISIVVACRNRNTWREVVERARIVSPNDTEIIVVDWSSRKTIPDGGPLWTTIRVENVDSWMLAQAYNVGLERARGAYILKLDCDTRLACMPPRPTSNRFHAGNWRRQGHLNGVFFAPATLLRKVGGYDERLYRYGWDDSDLYQRMEAAGAIRGEDIPCVHHIPHGARKRGVHSPIEGEILTQENRICIGLNETWRPAHPHAQYRHVYNQPTRLLRVWQPPTIEATSTTCNPRLATAVVILKLFSRCQSSRCLVHFWNEVNAGAWGTVRELVMRLVPTHIDEALWCIGNWTSFVDPSLVPPCHTALLAFDSYVAALTYAVRSLSA